MACHSVALGARHATRTLRATVSQTRRPISELSRTRRWRRTSRGGAMLAANQSQRGFPGPTWLRLAFAAGPRGAAVHFPRHEPLRVVCLSNQARCHCAPRTCVSHRRLFTRFGFPPARPISGRLLLECFPLFFCVAFFAYSRIILSNVSQ